MTKVKGYYNNNFREGIFKYFNGTNWIVAEIIKRWNGTIWETLIDNRTNKPFGFAATTTGVTGGGNAIPFISSDPYQLDQYLKTSTPKVVRINASINNTSIEGGYLTIGSNTTLICDVGVKLTNIGIKINDANNIIIRNLTSDKVQEDNVDNDNISIRNSHHIWIDHCDLSADPNFRNIEYNFYDGLIDIVDAGDNITISHCYFHDSYKPILIGNDQDWQQNIGKLNITIAFNKFERCHERMPLLMNGKVHLFNNYYKDCGIGTGSGQAATAIHEGTIKADNNYFENTFNPLVTQYSTEADGYIGNVDSNIIVGGSGPHITTPESTWDPINIYNYLSYLKPAADVPTYVNENAGALLT